MRFIFLTIDGNHNAALRTAAEQLRADRGLDLSLGCYDAATLRDPAGWERLARDIARADFVFGARLFGEDLVRPLEQALAAAPCPVLVITSNPALIRCTRLGSFSLRRDEEAEPGLLRQWVRKLRPQGGAGEARRQLAVLRNLSKLLKLIPGKARDLYTYIASHQYWLNSSPENLRRLLCLLIERYVPGYRGKLPVEDPLHYPEVALYHPDAPAPFEHLDQYLKWRKTRRPGGRTGTNGTIGLLTLRTVTLSGNTAHLDALIRALEARGLEVRAAYAGGLDLRPAIERFLSAAEKGRRAAAQPATAVDLLVNATGFSLVGGPAEGRPHDAVAALSRLDVGYLGLVPLAYQRVEEWRKDDTGLAPIQLALSVALPELDGAAEPLIFGGPSLHEAAFAPAAAEVELAAERIARRVALRRKPNAEKRLAVTIFNFPPNLGNVGTAAFLDVFASLYGLMQALAADGYQVTVPPSVEALRTRIVGDGALQSVEAAIGARLSVADYRRLFPHYTRIEPFWGNAPGELLNDGKNFYILGAQFGNLFVGVQPSFGYERDPMRLLMAKDAAPNHAFAAYYAWLRHVFRADAVVHLGTHGALEFMPGKQAGMSADCWPADLIGELPNFYVYSVNNPSEATIAKRRSMATLVSYLVPPLQQAGLYKGLRALKDSIDAYRRAPTADLLEDIQTQAGRLGVTVEATDEEAFVAALNHELLQIEQRMVPMGLHVFGRSPVAEELIDFLSLAASFHQLELPGSGGRHAAAEGRQTTMPALVAAELGWDYAALQRQAAGDMTAQERLRTVDECCKALIRSFVERRAAPNEGRHLPAALWVFLQRLLEGLTANQEVAGLLHGLRGGFVPPSPSNDVVRDPAVLPTGRNVHSLDPYRVPNETAFRRARALSDELLARLSADQGRLPESVAVVLWGVDNLKNGCEGVAQVLTLIGARTTCDELGNVAGVSLIPLAELGRPRIDVVVTVSGIFRDLLGNQMALIERAALLAATADEPAEANFVRKHAIVQAADLGITLEEASCRVFANAPGSYGSNLNHLVESGTWEDDSQLSEAFLSRKSFVIGKNGEWREARALMERSLATVEATFQNVDSFEVGITDIDNYYESLGGVSKSVERLRGERPPVLVADAVVAEGAARVGSLEQMVRLETRTKLLNPKWYEAMLAHGYEGAREIEARVNHTYGWSATTAGVEDWVFQGVAETFVLDEAMRERLANLNPHAAVGVVRRLLEANGRGFWQADAETLAALHEIYDDLEDRLEGIVLTRNQ